jgi:hypothetical protein
MIINQHISIDAKVKQGEGNIVSNMGDEKVMLSISNGKYYNLGEMGGEIWDLVKEPMEVKQLVNSLLASFQVERKECEEQVVTFLNHLFDEDLIEIVKENI